MHAGGIAHLPTLGTKILLEIPVDAYVAVPCCKTAQQCRTPKRGRLTKSHDVLAFWSAAVPRRF